MTYLRFHWIFNIPLLFVLTVLTRFSSWSRGEIHATLWVVLAAVVFTTPWDNYAARRGIWGFPREKYTLRLGWLPVEEYLFFVLQTLNVIMAIRVYFYERPYGHYITAFQPSVWTIVFLAVSVPLWIVMGLQVREWARKKGPRVNYTVHLVWFLPILYMQWLLAPGLFRAHAELLAGLTLAFGIYYTIADLIAVDAGLWFFDEKQVTGWKIARILPWEEMAFFFLTSLLVAQSYLLLLPPYER